MSIASQAPTRATIEEWLIAWIAREIGMPPTELETGKSLLNYSLSSVTAMMLVGDLEEWLGLTLPPTLVWDYPSIAAIAEYLTDQLGAATTGPGPGESDWAGGGGPMAVDGLSDEEVDALLGRMMADPRGGVAP